MSTPTDQGLKVLIVEDEAILAMQIEQLLLEAGHDPVAYAMDAQEALSTARLVKPQLALVDLHLRDGLSGATVMRQLTRDGVAGLFLTANRRLVPEDFAGALGVLAKPFSEHAFLQALRYVTDHLQAGRDDRQVPPSLELGPASGPCLGSMAAASTPAELPCR